VRQATTAARSDAIWAGDPEPFRSRLVPADRRAAEIRRIGWLTRESVQSLVEDSRFCGRGALLEIRLAEPPPRTGREWVDPLTAALRRRGVAVQVIQESESTASIARDLLSGHEAAS